MLKITEDEAELLIASVFKKYRGVDVWQKKCKQSAMNVGYVKTLFGRRRDLDNLRSGDRAQIGYGLREAGNCLDFETKILTQRGWLTGHDVTEEDVALTKNATTGSLEWQKITKVLYCPNYRGEVVEFRSRSFSAVTTPNHRWLVYNKWHKESVVRETQHIS